MRWIACSGSTRADLREPSPDVPVTPGANDAGGRRTRPPQKTPRRRCTSGAIAARAPRGRGPRGMGAGSRTRCRPRDTTTSGDPPIRHGQLGPPSQRTRRRCGGGRASRVRPARPRGGSPLARGGASSEPVPRLGASGEPGLSRRQAATHRATRRATPVRLHPPRTPVHSLCPATGETQHRPGGSGLPRSPSVARTD